tara:strand:- start:5450 stop:5596 length:147 start_codon:yes stop_codon:yes gene_type:complete
MKRVSNRKKGRSYSGSTLRIAERILMGIPRPEKKNKKLNIPDYGNTSK